MPVDPDSLVRDDVAAGPPRDGDHLVTENPVSDYAAGNIQVLEGLEAVRKRPAMYIGDVGLRGLHHLVYEVVDNSVDEAMAGHCDRIDVTIHEDGAVTVEDNGRGIPVDEHPTQNRSALEVVMTVLHAGGKFDKNSYKVSGGLHGVGVSCVNALAVAFEANVRRDGALWRQHYQYGQPLHPVEEVRPLRAGEETGTTIRFVPDGDIFKVTEYRFDTLSDRLRELAYLNAGVTITLTDEREEDEALRRETYYSDGGVREFVAYLDEARTPIQNDIIYVAEKTRTCPSSSRCAITTAITSTCCRLSTTSTRTKAARTSPAFAAPSRARSRRTRSKKATSRASSSTSRATTSAKASRPCCP